LRRFFIALRECQGASDNTRDGALRQCWNWYLAASIAAQRDLSVVFVDDWRMPLSGETRHALAALNWKQGDLTPEMVARQVPAASTNLFRKD
jgi:hypothetical protein